MVFLLNYLLYDAHEVFSLLRILKGLFDNLLVLLSSVIQQISPINVK